MIVSEMPPPVSARHRPPLWLIGEYEFQDLTVELLAREPDLKLARLHGSRGYAQFGVDATAAIVGGGKLAASCKCCEGASVALIKKACHEFDDHKRLWTKEDVRRFVVVVAGYADNPKVQREEMNQRARYRRRKIGFELWDGTLMVQKIRKYPELVHQYLRSDSWPSILCGPEYGRPGYLAAATGDAEATRLREFLSESTRQEIDSLRASLRRGHRSEVREKLTALRRNRSLWEELKPEIQASALRLQASLTLEAGRVDEAESLVEEAARLCPGENMVGLKTRVRLAQFGPEKALDVLPSNDDDVETLCSRGSLLLMLARFDEAAVVLEAAYKSKPTDIDAVRLLSLLSATRNDIPGAVRLVEESMRLASDWEIVQRTRAVIFYLSALSSTQLQTPASAMPNPIEWAFVRRDDESARRLEEAADVFRKMSEDLDRPLSDRQILEIWWLACLANLCERQATAAQVCEKLIAKHPCNIYAVPWAMARDYNVDFARAAGIAEQTIEAAPTDVGPILILAACKVHAGDHTAAKEILTKYRPKFETQEQIQIWQHNWMMLLLMSGEVGGALKLAQNAGSAGRFQFIEVGALLEQARKTKDSSQAKQRLNELYGSTGDPRYLMLWVEQQALDGNWTAVNERASELLKAIPTQDALYLALRADFETRAYDQCLSRMSTYRGIFPSAQFPLDIRRLRIGCLERSGRPREALEEAKELLHEDGSTSTLVSFTRLSTGYGDLLTATSAASELADRSDLSADDAVSIADLLLPHAPTLSRRLFRGANPQNIPEARMLTAFGLSQRLAMEREQAEFRRRLEALVGQPDSPIRTLTQEDVPLIARAQQECHQTLALYENGGVPIHRPIDHCGFSVVPLLWSSPDHPYLPFEQSRFFILHGGRSGHRSATNLSAFTRLNVDITTIFLIHRLDLWEPIEQAFPEIRCSRLIVPLLNQFLASLTSAQPQIEAAIQEVYRRFQDKGIHVDTGENWFEYGDLGVSAAEKLRLGGLITEAEYARAIESLPPGGDEPDGVLPNLGERIRCSRDVLVQLATAGILGVFAKAFQVYIVNGVVESLQAEILAIKERCAASESIKDLVRKLGERFKSGKLQTFPEVTQEPKSATLALHALAELTGFPAEAKDLICADDRFLNGFNNRDAHCGVPIFTLLDILSAPAERRLVESSKIWQIRHTLRTANCFFIPFEAEEIAHHLAAAATHHGSVIETPELRVARQYAAFCFAQGRILQRTGPTGGQPGEIGFVIAIRKSVVEALSLVWGNKAQSDEARTARADWLVESLYIDYPGICRTVAINKSLEEERQLVAMSAATLMLLSVDSGDAEEGNRTNRGEYSAWIWNALFRRRCNADPRLLEAITKCVNTNLSQISNQGASGDPKEQGLLTAAILRIIARFPSPLRSRVQEEFTAAPKFEQGMRRVLKVEDLEFDAPTYIRQVSLAFSNGSAQTQALRTDENVTIRRIRNGYWDAIDLERPTKRKVHRLRNCLWGVLLESQPEMLAALRLHRSLFDISSEEFERLAKSLADKKDPFERIEVAAAEARLSLPFFYDSLEQRVRLNDPLLEADLMPETGLAFLRYYGDDQGASCDALALIAKSLSLQNRIGPLQAAVRFAALPISLSSTTEATFRNAGPDEQNEFLHALLKAGPSPMHRIHAMRLAHLAVPTRGVERLRRWLVRQHLSVTGGEERRGFLSMLAWVADAIDDWHAARQWDRSLRLMFSWTHASCLFAMYRRAHAPVEWITEQFHRPRGYQAITDLEDEFLHGTDAAAPDSVTGPKIAVSGLSYALSPGGLPLPEDIACDAKREWFVVSGEPHAGFIEIAGCRPNALGSFLGSDQMDNLRALLGEEAVGDYGATWRSRLEEQAVSAITGGTHGTAGWIFLTALYRDGPAPAGTAGQIEASLRALDFCEQVEKDRENQKHFLAAVAYRIRHVTFEETRAAIISSLIRLGEWYGSHDGTADEASWLLNLAMATAYPAAGRPSTLAEFQQLCLTLAQKFPKFAGPCRDIIDRLCHDLPIENGADYWPLAVTLRALDRSC